MKRIGCDFLLDWQAPIIYVGTRKRVAVTSFDVTRTAVGAVQDLIPESILVVEEKKKKKRCLDNEYC